MIQMVGAFGCMSFSGVCPFWWYFVFCQKWTWFFDFWFWGIFAKALWCFHKWCRLALYWRFRGFEIYFAVLGTPNLQWPPANIFIVGSSWTLISFMALGLHKGKKNCPKIRLKGANGMLGPKCPSREFGNILFFIRHFNYMCPMTAEILIWGEVTALNFKWTPHLSSLTILFFYFFHNIIKIQKYIYLVIHLN